MLCTPRSVKCVQKIVSVSNVQNSCYFFYVGMFILCRDYTDCIVFKEERFMKNKRGHSKVKRVAFNAQEAFDLEKAESKETVVCFCPLVDETHTWTQEYIENRSNY